MENQWTAESSVGTLSKDDVVQLNNARVALKHDENPKPADEVPTKKRKTRRGKCKRRNNVHPYKNDPKANQVVKPEAPYNSNRFLIEDHGNIDEIDEELRNTDQISTSTVTRTRDSSFSIDSDGEFYSTPEDEAEFLIKDFDDQYKNLQAESLSAMSKEELIQEYLQLEAKVELLNKRLKGKVGLDNDKAETDKVDYQKEYERLRSENETLRRENDMLRSGHKSVSCSSDSADSETDSSDSCSSTSSSNVSRSPSPPIDCPQTNGHSPTIIEEAI